MGEKGAESDLSFREMIEAPQVLFLEREHCVIVREQLLFFRFSVAYGVGGIWFNATTMRTNVVIIVITEHFATLSHYSFSFG